MCTRRSSWGLSHEWVLGPGSAGERSLRTCRAVHCHALGATLDLPHALAYDTPAAPHAAPHAVAALGMGPDPAGALWELTGELGAPWSLPELGMADDDVDRIADQVLATPWTNPREVTRDGVTTMLRAAWAGDRPAT